MANTSPRSTKIPQRLAAPTRLGAIEEDGGMLPDVPPRAHHRPISRIFALGFSPLHAHDRSPPAYSEYSDLLGPGGEKFSDLRNNTHLATRGGWRRLGMIAALVLVAIVALVVGLVVGLRLHSSRSGSSSPPDSSSGALQFPAGSYAFATFLDIVRTDCTSNPATWLCYPYLSYNQSATNSMAVFDWIIMASATNASDFLISSTYNPFAVYFVNASLNLIDSGQATEAYRFEVPMNKSVIPNVALTADGSSTSCLYDNTTFTAKLYTKMPKTYPISNATESLDGGAFEPWPYAMEIQQVVAGGSGIPECYKLSNGSLTESVSVAPAGGDCECSYQNFGP